MTETVYNLQSSHSLKQFLITQPAISAIVIAIQMIAKYCKKLKYRGKIIVVTDGRGKFDADDAAQITQKIKEDDIELVIM